MEEKLEEIHMDLKKISKALNRLVELFEGIISDDNRFIDVRTWEQNA